jgi:hypothetical protein
VVRSAKDKAWDEMKEKVRIVVCCAAGVCVSCGVWECASWHVGEGPWCCGAAAGVRAMPMLAYEVDLVPSPKHHARLGEDRKASQSMRWCASRSAEPVYAWVCPPGCRRLARSTTRSRSTTGPRSSRPSTTLTSELSVCAVCTCMCMCMDVCARIHEVGTSS